MRVPVVLYVFVPTVTEPPPHTDTACEPVIAGDTVKLVVTVLSQPFAANNTLNTPVVLCVVVPNVTEPPAYVLLTFVNL